MGPVERSLPTVLEMMEQQGTPLREGHKVPLEMVYRQNTITHDQYRAILSEWDNERRAERNREAIGEMDLQAEMLAERMRKARVPERFVGCPVDRRCDDVFARGGWAYIHGHDAMAVNMSACAMLKSWLLRNDFGTAAFARSTDVLQRLREDGADEAMRRCAVAGMLDIAAIVKLAHAAGMLVLADLGTEVATDWAVSRLGDLLSRRFGAELPTIVTTRLEATELAGHLGSRGCVESAQGVMELVRAQSVLVEA